MSRRSAIKRGLVLAVAPSLILPNEAEAQKRGMVLNSSSKKTGRPSYVPEDKPDFVSHDDYYTLVPKSDSYKVDGLTVAYRGESPNFNINITHPGEKSVFLTVDGTPSIGLGSRLEKYHVRAAVGDGKGTMELTFDKDSEAAERGGFDVENNAERVYIKLKSGEVEIIGGKAPLVYFRQTGEGLAAAQEGEGIVSAGNNMVIVGDYDIKGNNRAVLPLRWGSTALEVISDHVPHGYEFGENGSLRKTSNSDYKRY